MLYCVLHCGQLTLTSGLPFCCWSIHCWRHDWWAHWVVPLHLQGETHSAVISSASVAKHTQHCLLHIQEISLPYNISLLTITAYVNHNRSTRGALYRVQDYRHCRQSQWYFMTAHSIEIRVNIVTYSRSGHRAIALCLLMNSSHVRMRNWIRGKGHSQMFRWDYRLSPVIIMCNIWLLHMWIISQDCCRIVHPVVTFVDCFS